MKMKAEIGLMLLQAKEVQDGQHTLRSYGKSLKQIFPSQPSEETIHADTTIMDSRLQNCETIFCCLSYPVCGTLLWQPSKTNTWCLVKKFGDPN